MFQPDQQKGEEKVYSFCKLTLAKSPSHNDKVGIYSNGPTQRERGEPPEYEQLVEKHTQCKPESLFSHLNL